MEAEEDVLGGGPQRRAKGASRARPYPSRSRSFDSTTCWEIEAALTEPHLATHVGPEEPAVRQISSTNLSVATTHEASPALPVSKMSGVALCRSGVSDLLDDFSLDAHHAFATATGGAMGAVGTGAVGVGAAPAIEPPLPMRSSSTELRVPPPEPPVLAAGPSSSALASSVAPGSVPASPGSVSRSKSEALVGAALTSLVVGSHRDRGGCPFMEDADTSLRRDGELALFAVIDGHSGDAASHYLRDFLACSVVEHYDALRSRASGAADASTGQTPDATARRALSDGFSACERALVRSGCMAGACALVLMMQVGGDSLNLGWCGDCRAVLSRGGVAVELTTDHKPTHERERRRIESEGGVVIDGRLGGTLDVSRAFGSVYPSGTAGGAAGSVGSAGGVSAGRGARDGCDGAGGGGIGAGAHTTSHGGGTHSRAPTPSGRPFPTAGVAHAEPAVDLGCKPPGLSADAEVRSLRLTSVDEFVVLASDGLWEALSAEDAIREADRRSNLPPRRGEGGRGGTGRERGALRILPILQNYVIT